MPNWTDPNLEAAELIQKLSSQIEITQKAINKKNTYTYLSTDKIVSFLFLLISISFIFIYFWVDNDNIFLLLAFICFNPFLAGFLKSIYKIDSPLNADYAVELASLLELIARASTLHENAPLESTIKKSLGEKLTEAESLVD